MAKPIEIDVKVNGLSQVKNELKALKGELVNATDPKEIERLSQAAGALSDKIADASEKIKVFAAGSNFEKVSNGLGLIGNQLASLDFEGAKESAMLLRDTIKTMNPAEVIKGFKDFTSTIGLLGNAFVQMGIKLLANPLFLLVAVVVAVVAAIVSLKDKLKIAEQAFDLLMIPIKATIQAFKDLTDAIGLTSYAEEEAADKSLTASKKRKEAAENTTNLIEKEYKRRIELAKANGQDTAKLEKELAAVQQKTSFDRVKDIDNDIKTIQNLNKNATKAEIIENNKKIDELVKERRELVQANKDAANEIRVINATAATTAREDKKKQSIEDKKEAKRIADEKKKQAIADRKAELAIINATQEELNDIRIEKEVKDQKDKETRDQAAKDKFLNQYKDQAKQQANLDNISLQAKKENLDFQIGYAEQASAIFQDIFGKSKDQLKAGVVIDGAINIAKIITSTQAANAAALLPPPFGLGPIAGSAFGIKNTISGALGIAATVAATAKALQTINSGGSSGGGSPRGGSSGGSAVPIATTSGQANQSNTIATKTTEVQGGGQPIIVKAYVSETEITNSQNFVKKVNESAQI